MKRRIKVSKKKKLFESVLTFVHTRNISVAKNVAKSWEDGGFVRQKREENRRNPDTPPPFSAANGNLSKHTLHPSKMGEEDECIRQRSSTQILKKMLLFIGWGATEKAFFEQMLPRGDSETCFDTFLKSA